MNSEGESTSGDETLHLDLTRIPELNLCGQENPVNKSALRLELDAEGDICLRSIYKQGVSSGLNRLISNRELGGRNKVGDKSRHLDFSDINGIQVVTKSNFRRDHLAANRIEGAFHFDKQPFGRRITGIPLVSANE